MTATAPVEQSGGLTALKEALLLALLPVAISCIMLWPALLRQGVLAPTDILARDPIIAGSSPAFNSRPQNPLLTDVIDAILPWKLYARSELTAGRFPLWNPYSALGMHFGANIQSQVLSPFNLLWLILPPLWGLGAITVLKWTMCGLGMGLLLRKLGLGMPAAIFGSVAFQLSGPIVAWLQWPISEGLMWLPWMMWAALGWVQSGKLLWLAALSMLVAAEIFAGHIETSFNTLSFVSLFALATLIGLVSSRRLGFLAGLVGAGALGVAIATVQLLPFLDVVTASTSWVQRSGQSASNIAFSGLDALTWLTPNGFGWPTAYRGPFNWIEINAYVGAMTLLLAVWRLAASAFSRPHGWRSLAIISPTRPLFWVTALAIWASMAYGIPPLSLLRGLPGFNANFNWRLISLTGFCVIVLGSMGLDRLLAVSAALPARWWKAVTAITAIASLLFLVGGIRVWLVSNTDVDAFGAAWIMWASSLFCLGGALILSRLAGWLRPSRVAWLAVGLVTLDMMRAAWGFNAVSPYDTFYPTNALLQFLQQRGPTQRLAVAGPYLPANTLLAYRIADYSTYDPTMPNLYSDYARLMSPETFREAFRTQDPGLTAHLVLLQPSATLLSAVGIKWLLSPDGEDPNSWQPIPARGPIYARTMEERGFTLWENRYARPYAYLASRYRLASDANTVRDRLKALTIEDVNEAQIEDPDSTFPQGVSALNSGAAVTESERVTVARYLPGRVELDTLTERTRFLVVSEGWSPSWRAEVDGTPASIYKTNYVVQGVIVPTGSHHITLVYDPPAFRWGVAISLTALLLWLALTLVALLRQQRRVRT
jgi:hypothetical protein